MPEVRRPKPQRGRKKSVLMDANSTKTSGSRDFAQLKTEKILNSRHLVPAEQDFGCKISNFC
jgi:hypothetical protein